MNDINLLLQLASLSLITENLKMNRETAISTQEAIEDDYNYHKEIRGLLKEILAELRKER